MCLSYPAQGLGKKWFKLALLAVTTVGFASPLFSQIGPTVRLSSPVIQGLTATVNGVTRPGSAATRITGIIWNWGDGTEPVMGWFPQSHTYAVSGIYKITVTSAQSDGQTGFSTATVNLSKGLRQAPGTVVPGAPGRFVHVSGTEVTSEAECTSRDHPIEILDEHGTGTVRILSGDGTFASISSRNKIITVGPGEALAGTVGLRVLNTGPGFAIAPLIETPSWGRHQDSWKMISNIRPGVSNLSARINERAPAGAGTYYIVFAFALETNGASVAAATNWAVGPPVWDDGNDLAELDGPQILEAQQFGCAVINGLGEQGYHLLYEPADVIVVKVGGPSAAGELKAVPSHAMPTPLANSSYKLPIQIVNEQASDAPAPFVQQLVIDSSQYAPFETENLQNVRFFDDTGHVIPSWLESGNSRSSTRTVYWLRLPRGIRARGVARLFMTFAPPTQNMFDGTMTGEAPGLSPEYGLHDNGAQVFARYANFIGGSLPDGWSSNVTPGSRGAVDINNGVRLWHSATGGGVSFLGSDWVVQSNVVEMHLLSEKTNNGQDMIMFCSASPTQLAWTPHSIGYQNRSGLVVENNNSGTPIVAGQALPSPGLPAIIGFQGNTVFANYEPAITLGDPICGGTFLASEANTGFDAAFAFDWVRMRPPAPENVMPKVVF